VGREITLLGRAPENQNTDNTPVEKQDSVEEDLPF
jgi:hypothetical protein